MEEYWASRTGRWRRAMLGAGAPSLADRLYEVIRADVEKGQLPAGALLPTAERVAAELAIGSAEVATTYARLLAEGMLEVRDDTGLRIASRDAGTGVGDATQIRFEAALLHAVREAAARGLSTAEATGMFKAALQRLETRERRKREDP